MKIYELMKTVNENPQEHIGNEYKITKGHATGWAFDKNFDFDTFFISNEGDFVNDEYDDEYLVAFSPNAEVVFIGKRESVNIDDKVFLLAEKIKKDSDAVLKDYDKGYINYDFTEGCIISNNILLDFISGLWDVDLANYYTPDDLPRRR